MIVFLAITGSFMTFYNFGVATKLINSYFETYNTVFNGGRLSPAYYILFVLSLLVAALGIYIQMSLYLENKSQVKEGLIAKEKIE